MVKIIIFLSIIFNLFISYSQIDSTLLNRISKDTSTKTMNMDAIYNRPFLNIGKSPVAMGGYIEANWQYLVTDGVTEGHQLQARRMTLFVSSRINNRIKFLSEIEFEEGGKEIGIEFASLDLELHPLVNFRGGVIMNPIGGFNQNHDGPKWEFIDRPISATQLLPATWSNSGFGLFGKKSKNKWMFGYEIYISGSFDNTIIDNTENKTFLPAAKNNKERFEEINSGLPLITGKTALRHQKIGEIGISYMGGVYNKFQEDGLILDFKRRLDIFAVDFNSTIKKTKTNIIFECVWININIPSNYIQQYGNKQWGGFMDIVQPIIKLPILNWKSAVVNLSIRFEYVDWNNGTLIETGKNIAEDTWGFVPSISFRPSAQTVFRLNYRHQATRDFLGNSPGLMGGFQFGFSSYF
ncbi:MAG: hypothetical protein HYR91_10310 [Flavobacteriia bacterium]|nr:hypothetical protein [Flavobacteriia bacterium]